MKTFISIKYSIFILFLIVVISNFTNCIDYATFHEIKDAPVLISPKSNNDNIYSLDINNDIYFVWTQKNTSKHTKCFHINIDGILKNDISINQAIKWGKEINNENLIVSSEFDNSQLNNKTIFAYKLPNDINNIKLPAFKCDTSIYTWNWYVSAKNEFQYHPSDQSGIFVFKIDLLDAPELISPSNNTCTTDNILDFNWSKIEKENIKYIFEMSLQSDFKNILQNYSSIELTNNSFQDSNTLEPAQYYWRVRAKDKCEGNWSEPFTFIVCNKPSISNFDSIICDENIVFNWADSNCENGYTLEVNSKSDFTGNIILNTNLDKDKISYSNSNISNGTYFWRIKTISQSDCQELISDTGTFTKESISSFKLINPPNVTSPAVTGTSIKYEWETEANITYKFELNTSSNFESSTSVYINNNAVSGFEPSITYSDSQLYYWRITGTNSNNCIFTAEISKFMINTCALEISNPSNGYDKYFEMPVIQWNNTGVSDYTVEIGTDPGDITGSLVTSKTTASLSWDLLADGEYLQGYKYYVQVTENGGCTSDPVEFTIHGFRSTPDVTSPKTICNGGSGTANSITWVANKVYSTDDTLGAKICSYNDSDLTYIESLGASHSNFRYYGITRDLTNNRLFAGRSVSSSSCGLTMDRITIIENLDTTPTIYYKNCRSELPWTLSFANNKLFIGGNLTGCYNKNFQCSPVGCSNGRARMLGWNMTTDTELWHDASASYSWTAMWADNSRIYRNNVLSSTLIVDSATTGSYSNIFTMTLSETVMGIMRYDAGGNGYLIFNQNDTQHFLIYKILNDPINSAGDFEFINRVNSLPDKYNQGSNDTSGNIYFPGINERKLYKHNIHP